MTAAGQPRAGSLIDPRALMSVRNLELRARAVVEGFRNGLHRSPYHGFSVEFTEYRQYFPGDDPRHLDWRVYARSDRHFIKKFEDETSLRCHLVVDRSRSMGYGSHGWTKDQYAATLAATLASFLSLQGDAVGLVTFDAEVREYLPARRRPGHLRRLMLALETPPAGRSTDLVAPVEHLLSLVRKRGLILMLSDFLAPMDRLDASLSAVAAAGHEAAVFQVLDPAELALDFGAPTVFRDLETERTLFVDPASARGEYRRRLRAHTDSLERTCRRLGIAFHPLDTSQPLELALLGFLQERAGRRGSRSARRHPGRAAG